jgi:ABC-type uncharacterized transport system substrate-binding protein
LWQSAIAVVHCVVRRSFFSHLRQLTGVSYMQGELAAKQVGLLHELLPEATRFAVLANPNNPLVNDSIVADSRAAVSSIGAHIEVLSASNNSEIDAAFANLTGQRCQAILVSPGLPIGLLVTDRAMEGWYHPSVA